MNLSKKIVFVFFLVVIFLRPLLQISHDSQSLLGRVYADRYSELKTLYYQSQYVKKKNPSIIPDNALESFAAGAFLRGLNPILIVHDQPPMGRYLMALSILIFDNPNITVLLCLFFSAYGAYIITRQLTSSKVYSLVPVAIFTNEPLFLHGIMYSPLLEPVQLPFIIFTLYFFIKAVKKNSIFNFCLTAIMVGFVISTRFFALGLVLWASLLTFLIIKRMWRKVQVFLLASPLALVILYISYFKTIQDGSSLLHIIGIQKYMLLYHGSQLSLPFSFWDLFLFNRWHTWWGTMAIMHDDQWIILWPIAFTIIMVYLMLSVFRKVKLNDFEIIVLFWIIFYCLFLTLGNTSTRYFLPLTPFLYILAFSNLWHFAQQWKKR